MRHVSVQQLSAFVDNALSGVSRELVTRHLAACASCRQKHTAWKSADDALRQALAWTPGERTLEAWSSRVEMCITAERKGVPVPEFTPTLLPVIAPAATTTKVRMRDLLEGARGAMLSNSRDAAEEQAAEEPTNATPEPAAPMRGVASEARSDNEVTEVPHEPEPLREDVTAVPDALHDDELTPAPDPEPVPEPVAAHDDEPTPAPEPEPMLEPVAAHDDEPTPTPEPEPVPEPVAAHDELTPTPEPEPVPEPVAAHDELTPTPEPVPSSDEAWVAEQEREPAPADEEPEPAVEPEPEPAQEPVLEVVPIGELDTSDDEPPLQEPELTLARTPVRTDEQALEPEPEQVGASDVASPPKPEPELEQEPVRQVAMEPEPVVAPRAPARVSAATEPAWQPMPEPVAPRAGLGVVEPAPRLTDERRRETAARTSGRPRRLRGARRALAACTVLLAVLLTSPFMPEVIRIPLPERWQPRVPRVEFVRRAGLHQEDPAESRAAELQLATRQPVVPELVSPEPGREPHAASAPGDSSSTLAKLAVEAPNAASESVSATTPTAAAPPPAATTTARATEAAPAPARSVRSGTTPSRPSAPPEPEPELVPDRSSTVIPTRVITSVRLSPTPPRKPPEPEEDEPLPLLCGEVLDTNGLPVEGARVELVSPSLSVRTDRRGRFCVACPPGARSLRVEAAGFLSVLRTVELKGQVVETRISLAHPR